MRTLTHRLFLLSLVLVGFGGCRSKDPLDWKIGAASPNDFNEWSERNTPLLPSETRREFARAIQFLQGDSGLSNRDMAMTSARNPFCRRIDRKTVREAILDGYFAEKKFLTNRVSLEVENLAATQMRLDALAGDSSETAQLARSIAFKHSLIQNMEVRVAEIDARTTMLKRPE